MIPARWVQFPKPLILSNISGARKQNEPTNLTSKLCKLRMAVHPP
jgi:hypothetical protein